MLHRWACPIFSNVPWLTARGAEPCAPHVEALARAEGLEAHARAVALRRRDQFDPQRQD